MICRHKEIEPAKQAAMATIQKSDFSQQGKEFLLSKLAYTLQIQTHRADEDDIPVGASKFGGMPDMPPHLEWPVYNCPIQGKPLCVLLVRSVCRI